MNKFVVGYISFFDNVLKVEIVEATDWKDALVKHSCISNDKYFVEMIQNYESMDELIDVVYDCDATFNVIEIK